MALRQPVPRWRWGYRSYGAITWPSKVARSDAALNKRQDETGTGTHHITGAILNIATCQTHRTLKRPQQKEADGQRSEQKRCGNGCEADEWQVLQEKEK